MAGQAPYFLTGANAKIKINGVVIAYCTDFRYSVRIKHAKPKVLGLFEAQSIEPMSYDVSGSFNVIRYVADVEQRLKSLGNNVPNQTTNFGNGSGYWSSSKKGAGDIVGGVNPLDGQANNNLIPGDLLAGLFFDIEIYQKIPAKNDIAGNLFSGFTNAAQEGAQVAAGNAGIGSFGGIDLMPVAKIRKCRITGTDFQLTKRNVATQAFIFEAIYLDEDSLKARNSGIGEHLEVL